MGCPGDWLGTLRVRSKPRAGRANSALHTKSDGYVAHAKNSSVESQPRNGRCAGQKGLIRLHARVFEFAR